MGNQDHRNMFLAIALSVAVILGFQLLFPPQPPPEQPQTGQAEGPGQEATPGPGTAGGQAAPGVQGAAPGGARDRSQVIAEGQRVEIDTPRLEGSINLVGARLDDLTLRDYRETLDPTSPTIDVLNPMGTAEPYFAEFGWSVDEGARARLAPPDSETVWTADREVLKPGQPVTLRHDAGNGIVYERVYSVDEDYLFTVEQRVINNSSEAATLYPYGLVRRIGAPETTELWIVHEGFVGVFDRSLDEEDYDTIADERKVQQTTGGWFGITDKYWLVSLLPNQDETVTARFLHLPKIDGYQADYALGQGVTVQPGGTGDYTSRLFAGAKEVNVIDKYEEEYGIALFDRAVGFSVLYFLARPLFYLLDLFQNYVGNWGLAILGLVVVIKLLFFPLANKSYKAMSRMKALQPKMLELREKYSDDKQKLNQEMMALYKKEKVNPAAGCLPILVQIPVFFALYEVLFVTIEMRHAPFFGWINDLSAPDPTSIFNLFGLIPFTPPEFLMIGVWPLIMGVSMWAQMRLNPAPADPIQQKIFTFMPIVFTFLLARFPSGLVIYWAWNNILSIAQQYLIMRRAGVQIGGKQEAAAPKSKS